MTNKFIDGQASKSTQDAQEGLMEIFPNLYEDPEFILEGLKIDVAIEATRAINELGMTGVELAKRMRVEPPLVSRMLRHTGNLQLRTVAKLAAALKKDVCIRFLGADEEVVIRRSLPAIRVKGEWASLAEDWASSRLCIVSPSTVDPKGIAVEGVAIAAAIFPERAA